MKLIVTLGAALLLAGCSSLCEDPCERGRVLEAEGPRVAEKSIVDKAGEAIKGAWESTLRFNFNRDVLGCEIPPCECEEEK